MTPHINNLHQPAAYEKYDQVMIGNDNNIFIAHSEKGILETHTRKLYMQNLFCDPKVREFNTNCI